MSKSVCVIGTGYVGLVVAVGLADFGNNVIAVDKDLAKIDQLKCGKSPIYEPGIEEYLKQDGIQKRLQFSTDISSGIMNSNIIIIAVGTPMDGNGFADLRYVNQVVQDIAASLHSYKVIVIKSTVPVGTSSHVRRKLEALTGKKAGEEFDVVSNPEFLREGRALSDFLQPDRVVVGCDEGSKARVIISDMYSSFQQKSVSIAYCSREAAEIVKYTCNAFLATKIAFINEVANLSEAVGADIEEISQIMSMDDRISPHFLNPGPGYGGSCFPKDTRAFVRTANEYGSDLSIVKAATEANEQQKERMVVKLLSLFGLSPFQKNALKGKTVCVLGLAFKAMTDDIREAPAIVIVKHLLLHGACVRVYDPQAMDNFSLEFSDIEYYPNAYLAAKDSDAVMLLTEWDEFRDIDLQQLKHAMRGSVMLDARNLFDPEQAREHGFVYQGVGR